MSAKRLTLSAFFMALVIILSSSLLSIPVPGGHFYFNGIVIFHTSFSNTNAKENSCQQLNT